MHWLLLLTALAGFALALLASSATLLSAGLLLSLLATLAWSRCLAGDSRPPGHAGMLNLDYIQRLNQEN